MTRVYLAGANQSQWARVLEGQDILISFADISTRPGWWEREMLPRLRAGAYPSVILDSGAFTELSKPTYHTDLEEYGDFLEEYGHLFAFAITLDDILGDLAKTWGNTARLEERALRVLPVFHGREPWAVLEAYVRRYDRVGLGFYRDPPKGKGGRSTISRDQGEGLSPDEWLAKALDICEAAGVETHGLGMTRYAMRRGHDRLTTVDSTTWIAEYRAIRSAPKTPLLQAAQDLPRDDIGRLVARSYTAPAPIQSAADVAAIRAGAKGQAKTVIDRYGRRPFLAACVALATHSAARAA